MTILIHDGIKFLVGWIQWKPFLFCYLALKFISFPMSFWLDYSLGDPPQKWTPIRKYLFFFDFPFPTPVFWSKELYQKSVFSVYILSGMSFLFSLMWLLVLINGFLPID